MQGEGEDLEQCPSFNSYSVDGLALADTAARVIRELNLLDAESSDLNRSGSIVSVDDVDAACFDADFEFVSLAQAGELAAVFNESAGTVFPVFNHDLLLEENAKANVDEQQDGERSMRIPLEKLIIEDRDGDPLPSSSSSEADELESIQPGTYCVWAPKKAESADGKCKKSKSTGSSSKRWKLIELLRRSNSDGKDSVVYLAPSPKSSSARKEEIKAEIGKSSKEKRNSGEGKVAEKSTGRRISNERAPLSAHELFYVRNRMLKEEGKRRSYLPYRKDLVGFWANIPNMGKTFPPPF